MQERIITPRTETYVPSDWHYEIAYEDGATLMGAAAY